MADPRMPVGCPKAVRRLSVDKGLRRRHCEMSVSCHHDFLPPLSSRVSYRIRFRELGRHAGYRRSIGMGSMYVPCAKTAERTQRRPRETISREEQNDWGAAKRPRDYKTGQLCVLGGQLGGSSVCLPYLRESCPRIGRERGAREN